jgi:selenocysteine lyase/cysteine desulfurase
MVLGDQVRAKFASLVNAKLGEIALIEGTTAGENLVTQALNLSASGGRVVSDTLHYSSSLYHFDSLAKLGVDVVWVKPRDGYRINIADMEAVIDGNTRLVALSAVSNVNGFQHDLKAISEIAHARGAYVYADIVQAAGAVPLDLTLSGVDFAACSGYKWLMGDFGAGFLYVREDVLAEIRNPRHGYFQLERLETHVYPGDPEGVGVGDFRVRADATGHFACGTTAAAAVVQLDYSLDYIRDLGVERIQHHRQPLLDKVRGELEHRGYRCATPEETTSPILSFMYAGAQRLHARLEAAKVKIAVYENRLRISASVFNDVADIDRLLEALP